MTIDIIYVIIGTTWINAIYCLHWVFFLISLLRGKVLEAFGNTTSHGVEMALPWIHIARWAQTKNIKYKGTSCPQTNQYTSIT